MEEFANNVLAPVDTTVLANKINADEEFLDEVYDGTAIAPDDVEEYREDNEFNITIIEFVSIEDEEILSTFESFDQVEEYKASYEAPNNANNPGGNGFKPTTKARQIGNVKRRKPAPFDGEKTVAEIKAIITDLISNNPKRKQWPVAKKLAFAKKIKRKYMKHT